MPLSLEGKKAVVAEISEVARSSVSAVAAEYRGLSVAQMTEFRAKARDEGVYVRVVKNTLARLALAEAGISVPGLSVNFAGLFSKNEVIPSLASADWKATRRQSPPENTRNAQLEYRTAILG